MFLLKERELEDLKKLEADTEDMELAEDKKEVILTMLLYCVML